MKNNRSSHQTARKGWKPRQTSDAQLAQDIAESIRAHAQMGQVREIQSYTNREGVIRLVQAILGGER